MTNTLYLPRRHRRPLLFPPGLLALAWLLWLGCVTLPQMRGMQPRQAFMQISIIQANYCSAFVFTSCFDRPMPSLLDPICYPTEKLEAFRQWQDVVFTGNRWADYFSYQQLQLAIQRIQKDQNFRLNLMIGLRVHFSPKATYNSLVYSLDALNSHKISTYWVDFYQRPITLYAFTPSSSDDYKQWRQGALCDQPVTLD